MYSYIGTKTILEEYQKCLRYCHIGNKGTYYRLNL